MNSPDLGAAQPTRLKKWTKILLHFLTGQACVQLIGLVTGLLLLRWLSVEDYAAFSVAFAFQTTVNGLVDLGFSGSVVALVGERSGDNAVIGTYIRAAKTLRVRLAVIGIAATCVLFPWLTVRHHWKLSTTLLLLSAIVANVVFQTWMVYGAPLLIRGRLKQYYSAQFLAAAFRLSACSLLYFAGLFTAGAAALMSASVTAITGFLYRKHAREFVDEPEHSSPEHRQEMVRYLSPLMPGVIFTALQGQITLAIITIFGRTSSIAEIAALGRLGQFFLVLSAFNSVIVEPYIARVSREKLVRRYLQIACGAALISLALSGVAFTYPEPLLWLLGPKYQSVRSVIGWSVASSCVGYLSGVLWVMNSARRWVYWWYTGLYIGMVIISQILCVLFLDLSQTLNVMYFSLATSSAVLLSHAACAVYGLTRKEVAVATEPAREMGAAIAPVDELSVAPSPAP